MQKSHFTWQWHRIMTVTQASIYLLSCRLLFLKKKVQSRTCLVIIYCNKYQFEKPSHHTQRYMFSKQITLAISDIGTDTQKMQVNCKCTWFSILIFWRLRTIHAYCICSLSRHLIIIMMKIGRYRSIHLRMGYSVFNLLGTWNSIFMLLNIIKICPVSLMKY